MRTAKEKSVQTRALAQYKKWGWIAHKMGKAGWPDYLIIDDLGCHFWVEFKTRTGKLRPAQKLRMAKLRHHHVDVYVVDDVKEALVLYDENRG